MASTTKQNSKVKKQDLISYIEPNDFGDNGYDKDKSFFPLEDYCTSCDIIIENYQRNSCGIEGSEGTENLVWTITGETTSPFKGSEITPGSTGPDGKYVEGKRAFTTSYTEINYTDIVNKKSGVIESFGVESIDIDFTAYMFPSVTIKFVDVEGAAFLMPEEINHSKTDASEIQIHTFFHSLFTLPYPKITLKVKGFYGDEVAYLLTIFDFQSEFNNNNGNFDVTVKLIGYMYSLLTDVPMTLLLMAPYETTYGRQYWNSNVKNHPLENMAEGGEIPTLVYLNQYIKGFQAKLGAEMSNTDEGKQLSSLENQNATLESIKTNAAAVLSAISADLIEGNREVAASEQITGGTTTATTSNYLALYVKNNAIKIGAMDLTPIFGDGTELHTAFKNLLSALSTYQDQGNSLISGEYFNKVKNFSTANKNLCVGEYFYHNTKSTSGNVGQEDAKSSIWQLISSSDSLKNSWETKRLSDSQKMSANNDYWYGLDLSFVKDIEMLASNQIDTNRKTMQATRDAVLNTQREVAAKELKFDPTVRNITKIIFYHLETFMATIYNYLGTINAMKSERTTDNPAVWADGSGDTYKTDVAQQKSFIPPFPLILKRTQSTSSTDAYQNGLTEIYPTAAINDAYFPENDLINGLLDGAVAFASALGATFDYGLTDTQINGINNQLGLGSWVPTLGTDICNEDYGNNNPYTGIFEKSGVDNAGSYKDELFGHFALRLLNPTKLLYDSDTDYWENFGRIEAYNFYLTGKGKQIAYLLHDSTNPFQYSKFKKFIQGENKSVMTKARLKGKMDKDNNITFYNSDASLIVNNTFNFIWNKISDHSCKQIYDIPYNFTNIQSINNSGTNNFTFTSGSSYFPVYPKKDYLDKYNQLSHIDINYNNVDTTTDIRMYSNSPVSGYYIPNIRNSLSAILNQTDVTGNTTLKDSISQIYTMFDKPSNNNSNITVWGKYIGGFDDKGGSGASSSQSGENKRQGKELNRIINKSTNKPINVHDSIQITPDLIKDYYVKTFDFDYKSTANKQYHFYGFWDLEYYLCNTDKNALYEKAYLFLMSLPLAHIYNCYYDKSFEEDSADNHSIEILPETNIHGGIPFAFLLRYGANRWRRHMAITDKDPFSSNYTDHFDNSIYSIQDEYFENLFISWSKTSFKLIDSNYSLHNADGSIIKTTEEYEAIINDLKNKGSYLKYVTSSNDQAAYTNSKHTMKNNGQIYFENNPYFSGLDTIMNILFETSFVINSNISSDNLIYKDKNLEAAFNGFTDTLQSLIAKEDGDSASTMVNNTITSNQFSNDVRLSLYKPIKNLYDGWLAANNAASWTVENGKLFKNFIFMDPYWHDIGSKLVINLNTLTNSITQVTEQKPGSPGDISLLDFLSSLYQQNELALIPVPQTLGNDLMNKGEFTENLFRPIPYIEKRNADPNPSFIVLHYNEISTVAGITDNNYNFQDDGMTILDSTGQLDPDKTQMFGSTDNNTPWLSSVPIFGVTFARGNQSFFTSIAPSMQKPQMTEAVIQNVMQMVNTHTDTGNSPFMFTGQDLYRVYSNYAYQCTVEMLGNAQITSMMLFQLNNIPMFNGLYVIMKVTHTIRAGQMITRFVGQRLSRHQLPLNQNVIDMNSYFPAIEGVEGGINEEPNPGSFIPKYDLTFTDGKNVPKIGNHIVAKGNNPYSLTCAGANGYKDQYKYPGAIGTHYNATYHLYFPRFNNLENGTIATARYLVTSDYYKGNITLYHLVCYYCWGKDPSKISKYSADAYIRGMRGGNHSIPDGNAIINVRNIDQLIVLLQGIANQESTSKIPGLYIRNCIQSDPELIKILNLPSKV